MFVRLQSLSLSRVASALPGLPEDDYLVGSWASCVASSGGLFLETQSRERNPPTSVAAPSFSHFTLFAYLLNVSPSPPEYKLHEDRHYVGLAHHDIPITWRSPWHIVGAQQIFEQIEILHSFNT